MPPRPCKPPLVPTYTYAATVLSVHDADTLTALVDLGFSAAYRANVRLLGCNARELSLPGGKEAAAYVQALIPYGTQIVLRTVKVDKYGGRYDAQVQLPDGSDLALTLIDDGWAAPWDGSGTKPVPPWPRH